jgi:hypothetical protein
MQSHYAEPCRACRKPIPLGSTTMRLIPWAERFPGQLECESLLCGIGCLDLLRRQRVRFEQYVAKACGIGAT